MWQLFGRRYFRLGLQWTTRFLTIPNAMNVFPFYALLRGVVFQWLAAVVYITLNCVKYNSKFFHYSRLKCLEYCFVPVASSTPVSFLIHWLPFSIIDSTLTALHRLVYLNGSLFYLYMRFIIQYEYHYYTVIQYKRGYF